MHFLGRGNPLGSCGAICEWGVREGTMPLACLAFSHFFHYPQAKWALLVLIPGGWVQVHSMTLWVSPMNSPVRLGVSPTITNPTDFFSQRFWGFISLCWSPGLCSLSLSPVVPPDLSTHKCGTVQSSCYESSPLQLPETDFFFFDMVTFMLRIEWYKTEMWKSGGRAF